MNRDELLEIDVFDLLKDLPYVTSEEELAIEDFITEYKLNKLKIDATSNEALSLMLQDVYVGDIADKIRGIAAKAKYQFSQGASALTGFVRFLQRITYNHIVTEKFIRSRFDGLKAVYVNYFYKGVGDKESYIVAPSYETMSKRLTGLNNCVQYLKRAAESTNPANTVNDETYAKLMEMSSGVLAVRSSGNGLVNHFVWQEPKLEQTYLVGSPWSKPENIDNLCNAVLFVRYKTMEGVDAIVKSCLKRTQRLSAQAEEYASYDEVTDETAEQYMHDYGSAYMISKMLKDILKQGIQREINTLAINYIHKLKTIKHDE